MAERFLKYLDDRDWERLMEGAARRRFEPEAVILAQGEAGHAIFMLERGSARVERRHGEFYVEIARLGPGEVFGEMSFLEGYSASASVVAAEPCEVTVLEGQRVEALLEADAGFAARFYRSLAEILSRRLRQTTVDGIAEFSWGGRVLDESAYAGAPKQVSWE